GTKLASISSLIYAAFAGGWSYFAFSTMKDEGQVALNSKVFEYLAIISFASLVFFYPFIRPVFELLFPISYFEGLVVIPYLYLSPLLLMLFQTVGNQFLVVKKSYLSTVSLGLGALLNVVLNRLLIPLWGVEGAAVATVVGYTTSVIAVCLVTSHMQLHRMSRRTLVASGLVVAYVITNRLFFFENLLWQIVLTLVVMASYVYMYRAELRMACRRLKTRS
ncbi:MAG: polysaccharide biosynthesis protein, partial [Firmicutes bacterium]|nr:polysaccharide biosynthesis protein [Bacillota bacterium]